jgi:hypothetical protein
MRKSSIFCQCQSVALAVWFAVAGLSKRAHMRNMAIKRELYMDTDSEEEISIGTDSNMLLRHRDRSSSADDSEEDEQEPDCGTWQTRNRINMCAVLPFTGPPHGVRVPVSNIVRNSTPPPRFAADICSGNQWVPSSVLCCRKR